MGESGCVLRPTKGYHFVPGAYVEYDGKLDAGEREALVPKLQAAMERLITQSIPTVVGRATHSALPTPRTAPSVHTLTLCTVCDTGGERRRRSEARRGVPAVRAAARPLPLGQRLGARRVRGRAGLPVRRHARDEHERAARRQDRRREDEGQGARASLSSLVARSSSQHLSDRPRACVCRDAMCAGDTGVVHGG